ncbi:hypothetical protein [Kitasatospora sp. NPDC088548]
MKRVRVDGVLGLVEEGDGEVLHGNALGVHHEYVTAEPVAAGALAGGEEG